MTLKKLRETMTEQALMIESALRDNKVVSLLEIAEQCCLSTVETEFILEQMICSKMVCKTSSGHYKLNFK
ncbi:hypothetical protein EL09_15410 [Salmonella enterica subsp. enterica]|nr:hypothetical protein [Salmonella enterica subsp. enterica]MIF51102.1 hypothetical protein [Salmonella enterica subsp. enterica]